MKKFFSLVFILLFQNIFFAQGCSDAGICSVHTSFDSFENDFKNRIEVASLFGAGEEDLTYFSPHVAYVRKITERFSLSTKLTYSRANGSLGTTAALGDIYLVGNYTFQKKNNKQWSTLLGWKFPLNRADLKIDGNPLPLDYQSSLGTLDLFLGTNLNYKNWDFNVALQVPVRNSNNNSYFADFSETDAFPSTNKFERKSDALIRTTYTIKTTAQKFTFKPNLLLIYHLGEDSFENQLGNRETLEGSKGVTLNGNIISSYNITNQSVIELSLAAPFIIRDIRPDGLTRSFVLALSYGYSF